MTTTHKDPYAVIEQLVGALEAGHSTLHIYPDNAACGCSQCKFVRLRVAALAAGREALKLRTCTWTQHDDIHMPGTYETECGELWSFVEGGPSDNKTKFCHGCGGLVYEPVGINGLTEAETSATMSVLGLSKPTEPAPKRPPNCGTGNCSCIECVMEPAPSTDLCLNCAGYGWEPHVYKGRVPCSFCKPAQEEPAWAEAMANPTAVPAYVQACLDARPVGELTDEQIRSIAEAVGEEMWPDSGDVGWTDEDTKFHRMFFVRALETARTQPERVPLEKGVAREPLTGKQIETLREKTFSTNNPFCPVDSKSMRKAVQAAERAHGITGGQQ